VIQDIESGIEFAVHFDLHCAVWRVEIWRKDGCRIHESAGMPDTRTPSVDDAIEFLELALALQPPSQQRKTP
jgi:hypothetical protein